MNYLFQMLYLVWFVFPKLLAAAPYMFAQPGCNDTCGNVTIPYPFGIGTPNCFLNEWFEVLCRDDRPYLSKYYGQSLGGEVLDVSSVYLLIKARRIRVCKEKRIWIADNLPGSPFKYNYNDDFGNRVEFVGCGDAVVLGNEITPLKGCTSTCDPYKENDGCKIGIPSNDFQNLYVNVMNLVIKNDKCASVTIGKSFTSELDPQKELYGISLEWRIPEWMGSTLKDNSYCHISEYGGNNNYRCDCPEYCRGGSPYILNGCQGHSNLSYCASQPQPQPRSQSRKILILLVVGSTSIGILLLGTAIFWLYKSISKRMVRNRRKKFFRKNGGLLLQQQLSVDENMVDKVRFFTSIELDKATDNFNENRVLGRGGQGTVYKGMLVDGKIVAIKKSKLDEEDQVEQFINEVVLLSQINHRNVVKLFGCCLETEVPMLVYEFIPNGTLYDLIHNHDDEFMMSWEMRLRIATEVGSALAYLHSASSFPIYHRDVKSSNVLLDEKFIAKVSDFGISRHVTIEQSHLTTIVKGTFGYLDPEYFQSNQFTHKSDVYSYGVVLVELLTRQKPIPSTRNTDESCLGLATRFLMAMEEDRLDTILDSQIVETASDEQLMRITKLAQRCLNLDGRRRPSMKEVAMELESIKMSAHGTSDLQNNYQGETGREVELVIISGETNTSWTTADDTMTSSNSDTYPLLSGIF